MNFNRQNLNMLEMLELVSSLSSAISDSIRDHPKTKQAIDDRLQISEKFSGLNAMLSTLICLFRMYSVSCSCSRGLRSETVEESSAIVNAEECVLLNEN